MTITVAALCLLARQRADMQNSTFRSDADVMGLVSDGYKELYDLIVSKFQDDYVVPLTFTIASGDTYDLPATFYKLVGLDRDIGGGDYYELSKFNFQDRNSVRSGAEGLQIGSYRAWYIPLATALTTNEQTVSVGNGWEEYAALYAAKRLLSDEESDTSSVDQMLAKITGRIEVMASQRDIGSTERVTDVSQRWREEDSPYTCLRYRIIGSKIYIKSW